MAEIFPVCLYNGQMKELQPVDTYVSSRPIWYGERGIFGGGSRGGSDPQNIIDYITISTTGNATTFGTMPYLYSVYDYSSFSNGTRGIFAGGYKYDINNSCLIDYITIATTGNSSSFGTLTVGRYKLGGVCNSIRGVCISGSNPSSSPVNIMDYITVSTTGNAIDFGDLSPKKSYFASIYNLTRGIISGGRNEDEAQSTSSIEYITIANLSNTSSFGNLTNVREGCGFNSETRGITSGGYNSSTGFVNTIDYITIATTGNATDFGTNSNGNYANSGGCSNNIRGIIAGGTYNNNVISYVTIASTGNATDFGDLTGGRTKLQGCSGN